MSEQVKVMWTRPIFNRFKLAYARAVKDEAGLFTFDGREYVVSYAKYLIEYLETKVRQ